MWLYSLDVIVVEKPSALHRAPLAIAILANVEWTIALVRCLRVNTILWRRQIEQPLDLERLEHVLILFLFRLNCCFIDFHLSHCALCPSFSIPHSFSYSAHTSIYLFSSVYDSRYIFTLHMYCAEFHIDFKVNNCVHVGHDDGIL